MSLQDGKLQLILLQVIDMPEHNPGDLGGTMRLGLRRTVFTTENSILKKLYGDVPYIEERHRHRYEVRLSSELLRDVDTWCNESQQL